MKIKYINIKTQYGTETVDELPYNTKGDRNEFARVLNEYKMSDPYNVYYSSQRCTNEWMINQQIKQY